MAAPRDLTNDPPLQIVFEHLDHSEALETRVREESEKLARYAHRLSGVRCVIARPQHRRRHGDHYQVRVSLTLPGAPAIVVRRNPPADGTLEDVGAAIRNAFDAARRRLQDLERRRTGHLKSHEGRPGGVVSALVPTADHGFIAADDGREIYFHRNSVANDGFEALRVGARVSFSESRGDKGPQASLVAPAGYRPPKPQGGRT